MPQGVVHEGVFLALRDHHDREVRSFRLDGVQDIEPVHSRHAMVEQNGVEGAVAQHGEAVLAVRGRDDIIAV